MLIALQVTELLYFIYYLDLEFLPEVPELTDKYQIWWTAYCDISPIACTER